MERKNFAVLCAAVLCFWLFALALGTAEGVGLRAVMHPEERAVSADVEEAAEKFCCRLPPPRLSSTSTAALPSSLSRGADGSSTRRTPTSGSPSPPSPR